MVINYQMQFESIEPSSRCFAASGKSDKGLVMMDAWILAHGKRSRVNEGDTCACAQAGTAQVSGTITEGISSTGADQAWKFIA